MGGVIRVMFGNEKGVGIYVDRGFRGQFMITVRIIMKSHQLSSPRTTNEECLISEEKKCQSDLSTV